MEYGLIGGKLSHSFSPKIHNLIGGYAYHLKPLNSDDLAGFFRGKNFKGINVTVPYKKAVIPYLHYISPLAKKIGAVNTVVNKGGLLYGYNTDYYGFLYMLKFGEMEVKGKNAYVLGSGGASNTAVAVLNDLGAKVTVISRSGDKNYEYLKAQTDVEIIVNTTPVGTYPNAFESPVNLLNFPNLKGVVDLVYNPSETELIYQAKKIGVKCVNGLSMLVAQAKRAVEIFTEKEISDDCILPVINDIERETKNIILIGMPGAGKSTIGEILALKTGKEFIDTDTVFEEEFSKSAGAYILEKGESAFRKAETDILKRVAVESGKVIATGGGIVTVEENLRYLSANSKVVWLKRDLDKLERKNRPLSKTKTDLENLYKTRKPLYQKASNFSVLVNGNAEKTADEILEILGFIKE